MRAYPIVKDTPSRKQRKSQRKTVFEENRIERREARKARRKSGTNTNKTN